MSGSLTAWFPERLTTQAGVSGVASSRAITASTPILLPCEDAQQQRLLAPLYADLCICGRRQETHQDPVERRWRPSPLHVSQNGGAGVKAEPVGHQLKGTNIQLSQPSFHSTLEETFSPDLLDLLGCDRLAISGYGTLGHNDHVKARASCSLLQRQPERVRSECHIYIARLDSRAEPDQAPLHLPASCTGGPPTRDLGASLG